MQPEDLKSARKALGLSQEEMAKAMGVSRVLIGQMERGKAPIEKRTAWVCQHLIAIKRFTEMKAGLVERTELMKEGVYRISRTDADGTVHDYTQSSIKRNEEEIADLEALIGKTIEMAASK